MSFTRGNLFAADDSHQRIIVLILAIGLVFNQKKLMSAKSWVKITVRGKSIDRKERIDYLNGLI
jgi:hypothetical protein